MAKYWCDDCGRFHLVEARQLKYRAISGKPVQTHAKLLDRFIEAVVTGKACRTSDEGPRRHVALSLGGLAYLTRHKLWPAAMRRLVDEVRQAHPEAQRRFLDAWTRVSAGCVMRPEVGDDDLLIAALRILLPSYNGPDIVLYRGQLPDAPIGLSWSCIRLVAVKFALYGDANVDAFDLEASVRRYRPRHGVVLRALAPTSAIISLGKAEGEYIVDPRQLSNIESGAP